MNTRPEGPKAGDVWFKNQPIGINTLSKLMPKMATAANLTGSGKRFTNHSARKTLVQKLSDENVPPTQIMQVTGHRNLQSVTNYSHLSAH